MKKGPLTFPQAMDRIEELERLREDYVCRISVLGKEIVSKGIKIDGLVSQIEHLGTCVAFLCKQIRRGI